MTEIEHLREELESMRAELLGVRVALEQATSDRKQYRALYVQLLERCRLLERGIVAGKKAERFQGGDEAQLSMQLLGMMLRPEEASDDAEASLDDALAEALEGDELAEPSRPGDTRPPRRPRRGRRTLPVALPRVEIEVLPPEVMQEGLENLRRIFVGRRRWWSCGSYGRSLPARTTRRPRRSRASSPRRPPSRRRW